MLNDVSVKIVKMTSLQNISIEMAKFITTCQVISLDSMRTSSSATTETSKKATAAIICAKWKGTGSVQPTLNATISKTLLRKKVWLRSFAGTGRWKPLTGSNAMMETVLAETAAVASVGPKMAGPALEPTTKK